MVDTPQMIRSTQTWQDFVQEHPNLPSLVHTWMLLLRNLVIRTPVNEQDYVGHLIMTATIMSLDDVNDIMTLSHYDSHAGAQKILRSLYERIVTLKYISENQEQAQAFINFDSIDTEKVMAEIKALTGLEMQPSSKVNLNVAAAAARKRYRQPTCPNCKERMPLSWTTLNSKDMAWKVGLGHMYLHAFLVATKHMHPTYWSIKDVRSSLSVFNTLNITHELIVHLVLIHRRYYAKDFGVTPMMNKVINDFLAVWTISLGTFDGLLTKCQLSETGKYSIYYG